MPLTLCGLFFCSLIMAHPKTMHLTIDNDFTTLAWYIGFFAPVLFFASVGVSLPYQVNKRSKIESIYKLYAPYTWVLLLTTASIMMFILLKLNDLMLANISNRFIIFAMNYHNFLPAVRKLTKKYTDRKTNVSVGKNM